MEGSGELPTVCRYILVILGHAFHKSRLSEQYVVSHACTVVSSSFLNVLFVFHLAIYMYMQLSIDNDMTRTCNNISVHMHTPYLGRVDIANSHISQ